MMQKMLTEMSKSRIRNDEPSHATRRGWLKNGNIPGDPNKAPRCGALSGRSRNPCRGPAVRNGRCRMHGGKSTGAKTPEGIERVRKANWIHGCYSAEAQQVRREVRQQKRTLRETFKGAMKNCRLLYKKPRRSSPYAATFFASK